MPDLHYAAEKYSSAVRIMALSEGSLRDRLYRAYVDEATHAHPLRPGAGPPTSELAAQIDALHQRLTARPAIGDEGTLQATINGFTDDEVRDAAAELLDVAREINFELREHN